MPNGNENRHVLIIFLNGIGIQYTKKCPIYAFPTKLWYWDFKKSRQILNSMTYLELTRLMVSCLFPILLIFIFAYNHFKQGLQGPISKVALLFLWPFIFSAKTFFYNCTAEVD